MIRRLVSRFQGGALDQKGDVGFRSVGKQIGDRFRFDAESGMCIGRFRRAAVAAMAALMLNGEANIDRVARGV